MCSGGEHCEGSNMVSTVYPSKAGSLDKASASVLEDPLMYWKIGLYSSG